jgi:NTE family protein
VSRAPRNTRGARPSRIGLALAGGGPGGAVYEIGALRALEDVLVGVDFNALHSYVGVSAGSFIAACLANRMTPTQLARAIVNTEPGEHPFMPEIFFVPAYREWAHRATILPRAIARVLREMVRPPADQRPLDALVRLTRTVPVGVFDNEPIRRYLERIFSIKGRSDDFRELGRRLTVVSADLESGRSVLFGRSGWDDVPISTAVQASTALPGLYPPVKVAGRYCVDGALLRTVHASIPLEDGADLLLCINPIVPVDLQPGIERGELAPGALVDAGLPAVLSQTFRTLVHSRMEIGMRRYATRFPRADVVLFEPRRDEYGMFFGSMFSFRSRSALCELAYDATRADLRSRRKHLAPILARHGITIDEDALDDPTRDVWRGMPVGEEPSMLVLDEFERASAALEHAMERRARRSPGKAARTPRARRPARR